jgi:hypothetical protein
MVRACDQCFTLRKLRSEQTAIISKSRLLMNLLPPQEGAEFRQALVVALAEGARQCAERLCAREDHSYNISQSMRGSGALPSPVPRLTNPPRGVGNGGERAIPQGRADNWPGAVFAPTYANRGHHDSNDAPPVIIRPVAKPTTMLDVGF